MMVMLNKLKEGGTALILSVKNGHINCVNELLSRRVDKEAQLMVCLNALLIPSRTDIRER